jgi:hypothetical protein
MKTPVRILVSLMCLWAAPICAIAEWPLGREMIPTPKLEPSPTVTVTGRFQIFTSPYLKGDTFMLDTESGRVWILEKDSTTGEFSMKRVRVEEVDALKKRGADSGK